MATSTNITSNIASTKTNTTPVLCCAGLFCKKQSTGRVIVNVGKHTCLLCGGNLHGFLCSDQKVQSMTGMTCLKCAAEKRSQLVEQEQEQQ